VEKKEDHGGSFPAAYIIFLCGFWFMLFLDQVLFKKIDEESHHSEPEKETGEVELQNGSIVHNDNSVQPNEAEINDSVEKKLTVEKAIDEEPEQRVSTGSLATFSLAVCLHSTIDGLAIGVFNQSSLIVMLALSVIIHKIPLAFTVGATFESNGRQLDKPTIAFFLTFICTTPLGIGIGMAIGASSSLVLVIIQGLSGGIFIYLAMCDLLIHEFHNSHDLPSIDKKKGNVHAAARNSAQKLISLSKFTAMLLGAAMVISLVSIAPKHSH